MSEKAMKFYEALEPNQYVFATAHTSGKVHVAHLHQRRKLGQGTREVDEETRMRHWRARGLCGFNPAYFWRPLELKDPTQYDVCTRCMQRWRAEDRPTIQGWDLNEDVVESDLALPFAWVEVKPLTHPYDKPKPNQPSVKANYSKKDEEEVTLTEVRRWVRGTRYVRLVKVEGGEYPYGTRYGITDDIESDDWAYRGPPEYCINGAIRLMALGGFP